jgi:hypothetical protein
MELNAAGSHGGVFPTKGHSEASIEAYYVSVDAMRLQTLQRNTLMSGLSPIAGSLPIGSITPSQCLQPTTSWSCSGRMGLAVISSQGCVDEWVYSVKSKPV